MLFDVVDRRFLFRPRPVSDGLPSDMGMAYDESWAETPDGRRLHCWFIPGGERPDLTWLWFGGVGGNLSLRVEEFEATRRLTGANVFGFDYGGFGRSEGKASERNTAIDARAALMHLRSHYGIHLVDILYMGVSLGAAVAIRLAAEIASPKGMAIVAPFASLRDMARLTYPLLTLGGWLAGNKFDSTAHVARIGCPLLILHGDEDTLVPPSQGRKLFDFAAEPKQFAEIPGANHTNIGYATEFWDALRAWVEQWG